MDRKWKSGASVTPPTLDNASDGYATAGNPGLGVPATKPGPHMFHMLVEEMLALITAAGLTPDKTSVVQLLAAATLLYDSQGIDPGGRLTLTTGLSVTTADVAGATTIRYTPHMHDRIKLYDGTRWKWYTFTEMSQATTDATKSPAATAATKTYDMFGWDDAATLRCTRGPLWDTGGGSNTARGTGAGSTELEFFGGRWVNKFAITNGPAARRGLYVGSIATDASNQVNDTAAKRHVGNAYNRVPRPVFRSDPAVSWTYNTSAFRQANANAANQIEVLLGMPIEPVKCSIFTTASSSGAVGVIAHVGIGVDSTTVNSAQIRAGDAGFGTSLGAIHAHYSGFPGIGRHTLVWIENGAGSAGTTSWFGTPAAADQMTGMIGEVMA